MPRDRALNDCTHWYWSVKLACPNWDAEIAILHWCQDNIGGEAQDFVQLSEDENTIFHYNNHWRASEKTVWVSIKDQQMAVLCKLTWGGVFGPA